MAVETTSPVSPSSDDPAQILNAKATPSSTIANHNEQDDGTIDLEAQSSDNSNRIDALKASHVFDALRLRQSSIDNLDAAPNDIKLDETVHHPDQTINVDVKSTDKLEPGKDINIIMDDGIEDEQKLALPLNCTMAESLASPSTNLLPSESINNSIEETTPNHSSSLRRSQRASAKRAQEKLRGCDVSKLENCIDEKYDPVNENDSASIDGILSSNQDNLIPPKTGNGNNEKSSLSPRKLFDPTSIEATDPHFAIQIAENGAVIVLSDESDVSSLRAHEVDFLRKNFEKLKGKELTKEQLVERDRMIQELKTQLRIEEARLSFVKRIRQVHKLAHKELVAAHQANAAASQNQVRPSNAMTSSSFGGAASTGSSNVVPRPPAYRPPVANVPGSANQLQQARLAGQQRQSLTNAQGIAGRAPNIAVTPLMNKQGSGASLSAHNNLQNATIATGNAASDPTTATATATPMAILQTPAQREAAAKMAWRRQMERTLLQIPPPKPPPAELHFVPNPNQLDFLYLVGLDDVVERLLSTKENHLAQKLSRTADKTDAASPVVEAAKKDVNQKNQSSSIIASKKSALANRKRAYGLGLENIQPYACCQCGTDYTPVWKKTAAANSSVSPHRQTPPPGDDKKAASEETAIACEQCVRSGQKRALRVAHTNLLREKFAEALKQEREIERQIKDGTFNFASLGLPTPTAATMTSTPVANNVGTAAANMASVQRQSGAAMNATPKMSNHHHNISTGGSALSGIKVTVGGQRQNVQNSRQNTSSSSANVNSNAYGNAALNFAAAMQLPHMMAAAQMLGVGWNPLLAAAAARFPTTSTAATSNAASASSASSGAQSAAAMRQNWQAALAAAAAAAAASSMPGASTTASGGAGAASGASSMPAHQQSQAQAAKELLKNMQQQLQQQQQQQQAAMQRQIYLDMMPRTGQKWK